MTNLESLTQAQQELYDWLIEYIRTTQHAPSIRQMMRAMNLRSPAPIQSRLELLGAIAAGGLVEPFTDVEEKLDLSNLLQRSQDCYALRVSGDSMIEDHIADGDLVIMRSLTGNEAVSNGEIVAARVEGHGTTLKRFYQEGEIITLQPSNQKYQPITANTEQVQVQGVLVGVWRGY